MLEAYTTLGYVAGKTERVRLLTAVVTAVVYRDPGLLAKAVTTLDVLSGGRAMLGIGAAWSEEKARGLGLFFPLLSAWREEEDRVIDGEDGCEVPSGRAVVGVRRHRADALA